ncbi:MAG: prepilin peptidase [Actinobacteria bacterium]|nr:prepilin peptidase [Actinomycetota bacterium]MBI3687436.1 prepilin peptidase [Actinomycetota bacterium]
MTHPTPIAFAAVAVVVGGITAGWVRAQVFIHSVDPHQAWRTTCPHCTLPLITSHHARAWLPHARCPHCRRQIGPPTGVVEATMILTMAALAWTVTDPLLLATLLVFTTTGVALVFTDLAVHRLPDRLTLPMFAVTATLLTTDVVTHHHPGAGVTALAGAVGTSGFYLLLTLTAGGGGGDVKLALSTGLMLGWHGYLAIVAGLVLGFALTAIGATWRLLTGRLSRGEDIAHAPGMVTATLAVALTAGYASR